MAEEFVRKEHFEEFVKRMESGLAHVNELADQRHDSMTQRLADAEKAREQNFVYLNQRFDDMNRSVNQRFDDMNRGVNQRLDSLERRMDQGFAQVHLDVSQMRNWLVRLYALVVFGFVGAIALILFKDLLFK